MHVLLWCANRFPPKLSISLIMGTEYATSLLLIVMLQVLLIGVICAARQPFSFNLFNCLKALKLSIIHPNECPIKNCEFGSEFKTLKQHFQNLTFYIQSSKKYSSIQSSNLKKNMKYNMKCDVETSPNPRKRRSYCNRSLNWERGILFEIFEEGLRDFQFSCIVIRYYI